MKAGAKALVSFEQLRAGVAHKQERHALGPACEVLEESQHGVIGPVDVLEHEHRRGVLGHGLEKPAPRGEQLVALCSRRHVESDKREQALAHPFPVGAGGHGEAELVAGRLHVVALEDAGMGLDDLAERPEADPVAVRQAATLAPGEKRYAILGVGQELGHDAALSDAGLAHDRHELHRDRRHRLVEERLQQRQVDLTSDKGAVTRPGEIYAEPGHRRPGVKDSHRLGLALQFRRLELGVVEDPSRCLVGGEPHGYAHHWRNRLDASGGVHGVAGHESLP